MKNFKRKIEVITGGKIFENDYIDIEFNTSFEYKEDPNEVEVKLFNLSNDTINNILPNTPIIVNAGYEGDIGTIFTGYVVTCVTNWDKTNKITTITGFDASDNYLNQYISKSYAPGITAQEIIRDLVRVVGMSIGEINLNDNLQYPNGRSIIGKLRDILKEIVQIDCNTNLQIRDGLILIRDHGEGIQTGVILNKDTGLLERPETLKPDIGEDEKIQATHRVTCLLNYRIKTFSALRIETQQLSGNFIVLSGSHSGASRKGDFKTEMDVLML